MEAKFANPVSAYVARTYDRSLNTPRYSVVSFTYATNSLATSLVPRRSPMPATSCDGTPISTATGEKRYAKIRASDRPGLISPSM